MEQKIPGAIAHHSGGPLPSGGAAEGAACTERQRGVPGITGGEEAGLGHPLPQPAEEGGVADRARAPAGGPQKACPTPALGRSKGRLGRGPARRRGRGELRGSNGSGGWGGGRRWARAAGSAAGPDAPRPSAPGGPAAAAPSRGPVVVAGPDPPPDPRKSMAPCPPWGNGNPILTFWTVEMHICTNFEAQFYEQMQGLAYLSPPGNCNQSGYQEQR